MRLVSACSHLHAQGCILLEVCNRGNCRDGHALYLYSLCRRLYDATQLYLSESVTIYTGDVLRDKPTNPTISLGVNYTRLEIIEESVGDSYRYVTFQQDSKIL